MRTPSGCLFALGLIACNRDGPKPPRDARATARPASAMLPPAVDAAPTDAGPRVVLRVRLRNVGPRPLRILTNPDANEMIHVFRVNLPPSASDRAAMLVGGTRVKLFSVGQMALCGSDAGGGYGGLGQPAESTLAPDESVELARWDGLLRAEINDPTQGVCQRESPAPPGRYRLHFDQPQLHGGPQCTRVLVSFTADGGAPLAEFRCHAFVGDGG